MYVLARLILFTTVIITEISAAVGVKEQENTPLQCYICVIERRGDAGIQTECSVSSPNVRTARCAKSHGYDRCIYYRARSLSTGAVLLRRQCATKKMCDGECLSFNHTDCQMKCCQGDLCNNGFFDVKKAKDDPDIEAAVIPVSTGREESSTTSPLKEVTITVDTGIPAATVTDGVSLTTVTTDVPVTTSTTGDPVRTYPRGTSTSTLASNIPFTQDGILPFSGNKELAGGPRVTPRTDCKDYREECQEHAAYPSYCQYHRNFMLKYCQVSCRFCEPSGKRENVMTTAVAHEITTNNVSKTTATTDVPITTVTTGVPTSTVTTDIPDNQVETTPFIENGGGFAGGPRDCRDLRTKCKNFSIIEGYCSYHYGFMLKTCPRSCGFCGEPEQPLIPLDNGEGKGKSGCMDLRENCTYYAKVDGYCDYNKDFMLFHCPFSCGFCGITSSIDVGDFPHPPVFPVQRQRLIKKNFPKPPTSKEIRWIALQCSECRQGYKHCSSKCILLLSDNEYEPTNNESCLKLLGTPEKIIRC